MNKQRKKLIHFYDHRSPEGSICHKPFNKKTTSLDKVNCSSCLTAIENLVRSRLVEIEEGQMLAHARRDYAGDPAYREPRRNKVLSFLLDRL